MQSRSLRSVVSEILHLFEAKLGTQFITAIQCGIPRGVVVICNALGPVLVGLWLAIVVVIKIAFYQRGIVIGDLFLYANALVNTRFPDQLLYTADYQLGRGGITTLVLDHFEPSSVLLIPFFRLFDTPLSLVVLQSLAPAVLAGALAVLSRRCTGAAWLGWAVAVFTLYNPLFIDAAIDGVYGFHHDAQYLIYAPFFLTCFLLQRFALAVVFLILFLGVKEDAAFFGIAFGATLALFDLPWGGTLRGFRLSGLIVAAVSALYFVGTVLVLPRLIGSPNIYAGEGLTELHHGLIKILTTASHNFFSLKWRNLWLYFFYAFGSPPFVVAGFPDLAMFSIMTRKANLYFNFTIVTFLAFGVLLTLMRLRDAPIGTLSNRWRRLVSVAFAIQLILCVPFGLWELHDVWSKGNAERWGPPSQPVSASDAEAAWQMVDLSCSVVVSNSLLHRFYRAPYWFQLNNISAARFVVMSDGTLPNLPERRHDWVSGFFATQANQLDFIGRSGSVTVWRNRNAPCLPW
jgi:uncharacterized membrane protein